MKSLGDDIFTGCCLIAMCAAPSAPQFVIGLAFFMMCVCEKIDEYRESKSDDSNVGKSDDK